MNKSFRGLGKIIRILQPPKSEGAGSSSKNSRADGGVGFQALAERLSTLEPGLQILDSGFPIREGSSRVDFLASNPSREFILIWVMERLAEEHLVRLLPEYDWVKRNSSMWQHLFPSLQANKGLKIQVWWLAREIDPGVNSMLSYVKDISLKIFRYHWAKKGDVRVGAWRNGLDEKVSRARESIPREEKKTSNSGQPLLTAPTALNAEEIKELLAEVPQDRVNYEDEITDPYCPLSELK